MKSHYRQNFSEGLKRVKRYNSRATIATEQFKSSTDSASLAVSIKTKNYLIWVCFFSWWRHKEGIFLHSWITLTGHGLWFNKPFLWLKGFVKTRRFTPSHEPLIDLLACLELKLWHKNPLCAKLQKKHVFHWRPVRLAITCDNMTREYAGELFKPSKDSWSLLVCTEKKIFEIWVWGCRRLSLEWKEVLLIFGYSFMTSSPVKWAEIVAQTLVVFQAGIWSCRDLDRLPRVSCARVMTERPLILYGFPRESVGIPLNNYCLFCHNFWTRNARKSNKPSKDSYCSLELKKTLSHKIWWIVWLPGNYVIIQIQINMRKHPIIMQTSTKNPRSQAKKNFLQSKLQVFTSLQRAWTSL